MLLGLMPFILSPIRKTRNFQWNVPIPTKTCKIKRVGSSKSLQNNSLIIEFTVNAFCFRNDLICEVFFMHIYQGFFFQIKYISYAFLISSFSMLASQGKKSCSAKLMWVPLSVSAYDRICAMCYCAHKLTLTVVRFLFENSVDCRNWDTGS